MLNQISSKEIQGSSMLPAATTGKGGNKAWQADVPEVIKFGHLTIAPDT